MLPELESETAGVPTEATPLRRQSSRREAQRTRVQQQLTAEVRRFVQRRVLWILLAVFALLFLCIVQALLLIWAISAAIFHGDKECDQPLKYYILFMWVFNTLWNYCVVPLVMGWVNTWNFGNLANACFRMLLGLPCWLPIVVGVVMVCRSKTCHETNPELYYPTLYLIVGQVVFMALIPLVAVFAFFGLRRLMLWVSTLGTEPGCQTAVWKLPKVPRGSMELLDDEDGKVMECSICTDSLDGGGVSVRTPCAHYFHEECLATWCKNHISCPICRGQIGEADEPEEGGGFSAV